ncbi:hypothetical protein [Klebsiella phage phiKp_21]|nr:hypothetical protein CPT_Muenster_111 [Klebsiella phage Muenster]BEH88418.1 hypothetical protein [Klebsiella phage phiKp_21]
MLLSDIKSFSTELDVIKNIIIKMIEIHRTKRRYTSFSEEGFELERGLFHIDLMISDYECIFSLRNDSSQMKNTGIDLSIIPHHQIILGGSGNVYISPFESGFSRSIALPKNEGSEPYILINDDALDEWKFQLSTLYDPIIVDIINLEEELREHLASLEHNNNVYAPLLLVVDLKCLEKKKHDLNSMLEFLENI